MNAPTLKDIEPTHDERHPERIDLGDGFHAVVETTARRGRNATGTAR